MAEWWSIEVFHADLSARRWKDSYERALVEAAVTNGAIDWAWHEHRTGLSWRWRSRTTPSGRRSGACPPSEAVAGRGCPGPGGAGRGAVAGRDRGVAGSGP